MARKKKKTRKARPSPLKADRARRHDFPHIDDIDAIKTMRTAVKDILKRLMDLSMIGQHSSRVEMVRAYLFNVDKHNKDALPFNSHGVGWLRNNTVHCLYAEISCLIIAFWEFADEPTDVNAESVHDFLEYLDGLCRDEKTITTADMGKGVRWRITNDRIKNGFKMVED